MSEADYAGLITAAHRTLAAPLIVIWDNLPSHISTTMRAFTTAHPDWLTYQQGIPLPSCVCSATRTPRPLVGAQQRPDFLDHAV